MPSRTTNEHATSSVKIIFIYLIITQLESCMLLCYIDPRNITQHIQDFSSPMKKLLGKTDSNNYNTSISMEDPVVTKNNPRSKPLNGLISASICVRKLVSASSAPAKNAPSFIEIEFSYNMNLKIISQKHVLTLRRE